MIDAFEQSYRRIFGHGIAMAPSSDEFFEAFYRRFLRHPEIAAMFSSTDMSRQVTMLRRSMLYMAAFYITRVPTPPLVRMATIHHRIGVEPAHYELWLDSLVDCVREFDPECTPITEYAWRLALTPGITFMQLGGYLEECRRPDLSTAPVARQAHVAGTRPVMALASRNDRRPTGG